MKCFTSTYILKDEMLCFNIQKVLTDLMTPLILYRSQEWCGNLLSSCHCVFI